MTKFSVFVLSVLILTSCSKKDIGTPDSETQSIIFYQDSNVGVLDLGASQTSSNSISVSFKTSFEKDVAKIEIMSSGDANNFCTVDVININENSSGTKSYSFSDTKLKGNPMFYMLRFTYSNGDWGYTPYYTIVLN